MKRFYYLILPIFATLTLSAEHEARTCGLPLPTEKELNHIENHWGRIISVNPNKIGIRRIKRFCQEHGLKGYEIYEHALLESNYREFEVSRLAPPFLTHPLKKVQRSDGADFNGSLGAAPLPKAVNNANCPSFPQIGDQGRLSSCVAWGSTYYQASHEIGLINGYNNKAALEHVLSPKWTYNILNNGRDQGLQVLPAYELLASNGAPSIASFPYDSNYLQWDLNLNDWIAAISNRTAEAQAIGGVAKGTAQDLNMIKGILNNGHILTFGTFIESWVTTKVKKDPSNPNSPHVGELAAAWVKGTSGAHFMTIVGYDDDVWIDVNGNGKVDQGEKGAFLVANSWGTNWGNKGFVWISYDAFRDVSAVANATKQGRVAAGAVLNSYLIAIEPKTANYKPKLIAQFSLTQSVRNQISIAAGVSTIQQTKPAATYKSNAIIFQGGAFDFNGTPAGNSTSATFALDLTDLISSNSPTANQRFYLILNDNELGHPTTLTAYILIDRLKNAHATCPNAPFICDNNQITPYIDYQSLVAAPRDFVPPEVHLTYPLDGETVSGIIDITVSATDDHEVDRVELYVDGELFETDRTLPYLFTLDTGTLTSGSHFLSAVAYDTSENSSTSSIYIHVSQ